MGAIAHAKGRQAVAPSPLKMIHCVFWGCIGAVLGLYWGYIGAVLGLH